jgi:SNF2 family DNA or RNA helicase
LVVNLVKGATATSKKKATGKTDWHELESKYPGGHWVTLNHGIHVYVHEGKVIPEHHEKLDKAGIAHKNGKISTSKRPPKTPEPAKAQAPAAKPGAKKPTKASVATETKVAKPKKTKESTLTTGAAEPKKTGKFQTPKEYEEAGKSAIKTAKGLDAKRKKTAKETKRAARAQDKALRHAKHERDMKAPVAEITHFKPVKGGGVEVIKTPLSSKGSAKADPDALDRAHKRTQKDLDEGRVSIAVERKLKERGLDHTVGNPTGETSDSRSERVRKTKGISKVYIAGEYVNTGGTWTEQKHREMTIEDAVAAHSQHLTRWTRSTADKFGLSGVQPRHTWVQHGAPHDLFAEAVQEMSIGFYQGLQEYADNSAAGKQMPVSALRQGRNRGIQRVREKMRDIMSAVNIPVDIDTQSTRIERIASQLHERFGKEPTIKELSQATGIEEGEVDRIRGLARWKNMQDIEGEAGPSRKGEGGKKVSETIADDSAVSPEESAIRSQMNAKLRGILGRALKNYQDAGLVTPDELEIVQYVFGRDRYSNGEMEGGRSVFNSNDQSRSYDMVAKITGKSKATVQRAVNKVVGMLREAADQGKINLTDFRRSLPYDLVKAIFGGNEPEESIIAQHSDRLEKALDFYGKDYITIQDAVTGQPIELLFFVGGVDELIEKSWSTDLSRQHPNGRWVTLYGRHVFIDADGKILAGPKHLVGRNVSDVKTEHDPAADDHEKARKKKLAALKKRRPELEAMPEGTDRDWELLRHGIDEKEAEKPYTLGGEHSHPEEEAEVQAHEEAAATLDEAKKQMRQRLGDLGVSGSKAYKVHPPGTYEAHANGKAVTYKVEFDAESKKSKITFIDDGEGSVWTEDDEPNWNTLYEEALGFRRKHRGMGAGDDGKQVQNENAQDVLLFQANTDKRPDLKVKKVADEGQQAAIDAIEEYEHTGTVKRRNRTGRKLDAEATEYDVYQSTNPDGSNNEVLVDKKTGKVDKLTNPVMAEFLSDYTIHSVDDLHDALQHVKNTTQTVHLQSTRGNLTALRVRYDGKGAPVIADGVHRGKRLTDVVTSNGRLKSPNQTHEFNGRKVEGAQYNWKMGTIHKHLSGESEIRKEYRQKIADLEQSMRADGKGRAEIDDAVRALKRERAAKVEEAHASYAEHKDANEQAINRNLMLGRNSVAKATLEPDGSIRVRLPYREHVSMAEHMLQDWKGALPKKLSTVKDRLKEEGVEFTDLDAKRAFEAAKLFQAIDKLGIPRHGSYISANPANWQNLTELLGHVDADAKTANRINQFIDLQNKAAHRIANYDPEKSPYHPAEIPGMRAVGRNGRPLVFTKTQNKAINLMETTGYGINGLNMGHGKTLSTIAAAMLRKAKGEAKQALVVLPPSATGAWVTDLSNFTDEIPTVYGGASHVGEVAEGSASGPDARKNKKAAREGVVGWTDDGFPIVRVTDKPGEGFFHVMSYNTLTAAYTRDTADGKLRKLSDVLLTGYKTKDGQVIPPKLSPDMIIADEAHMLKNSTSGKARGIIDNLVGSAGADGTSKVKNFFALTGTPFGNSLEELHSLIDGVYRGKHDLGTPEQFRKSYMQTKKRRNADGTSQEIVYGVNLDREQELYDKVAKYMVYADSSDLAREEQPSDEQHFTHEVMLDGEHAKANDAIWGDDKEYERYSKQFGKGELPKGFLDKAAKAQKIAGSAKREAAGNLIKNIMQTHPDSKVLVVSNYTDSLDALADISKQKLDEVVAEHGGTGEFHKRSLDSINRKLATDPGMRQKHREYLERLRGHVERAIAAPQAGFSVSTYRDKSSDPNRGENVKRMSKIDDPNYDEHAKVMVGSSKAIETGVNLGRATDIVLYDRGWSPSSRDQLIARINRLKESHPDVRVHVLHTKSPTGKQTIDDMLSNALDVKSRTFNRVTQGVKTGKPQPISVGTVGGRPAGLNRKPKTTTSTTERKEEPVALAKGLVLHYITVGGRA